MSPLKMMVVLGSTALVLTVVVIVLIAARPCSPIGESMSSDHGQGAQGPQSRSRQRDATRTDLPKQTAVRGGEDTRTSGSDEAVRNLTKPGFFAEPWERRWQTCEAFVNVPVTEITEPLGTSLAFAPKPDQRYHYVVTTATFTTDQKEPVARIVIDGEFGTRLDDKGQLIVEHTQQRPWGLSQGAEAAQEGMPPRHSEYVVREGDLYARKDSGVEPAPVIGPDRELLKFDLPAGRTPKVGEPWTTTLTGPMTGTATHTLMGMAYVGNVKTAQFRSDVVIAANLDALNGAATAAKIDTAKMGSAVQQKVTTYVDIETGLVVRREMEITASGYGHQTTTRVAAQMVRLQDEPRP